MLLDTVSTIWFTRVFPNIRPDAAAVFGGWLLLCNAVGAAHSGAYGAREPPTVITRRDP